jgi:enediyne biosynthesis protein E11
VTDSNDVYAVLGAEGDAVDRLVADLDADGWALPTPAPGWTIGHQVAHLSFISHLGGLAAIDGAAFEVEAAPARIDFQASVDAALAEYLADGQEGVLARWRTEREAGVKALAAVPAGETVPWLVTPLPPSILASAAIMELFGHGQDIADTLGVERRHNDGIAYLVGFGARTVAFGYLAHGLKPPEEEFRFEITAPSGHLLEFGPPDATQKITGPAVDFCQLITRRRHRDDLALVATGEEADHWLDIAQAYRGPAGEGRVPGQFAKSAN